MCSCGTDSRVVTAVTAAVRNLTRQPEQFSYGVNGLMRTSRLLDRDYKLGFDFNF